ncbi:MAG: DUF2860 domain-containing protein [Aquificaceae bacterium]|nr:DUF2860 domain-containing protein [Aquificaceae bacterium]
MKRAVLLLFLPFLVYGEENRLGLGIGFIQGKNNLSTQGSDYINSLGEPQDSFLKAFPLIDLQLRLRRERSTYFIRSATEEQAPSIQVGVERRDFIAQKTEFFVGVNPFRRVWKDPYLTGAEREETYQRDYEAGMRLTQGITSLRIRALYSDVEEDDLGKRASALRRDRFLTSVRYSISYPMSKEVRVTPSLNLDYSQAKGRASSYAGYTAGISGLYRNGLFLYDLNLSFGQDRYFKSDPILREKRRENHYSLLFSLTRTKTFHPRAYIRGVAGYRTTDANIDFYDRRALIVGILSGYSW